MKGPSELLLEVIRVLTKQLNLTCCKLDAVVSAVGGTPTLYNIPNSVVIAPLSGSYSSPECHTIEISVVGASGDIGVITVNEDTFNYPAGYSFTLTATTVFEAGMFMVDSSSTATVIVNSITAT